MIAVVAQRNIFERGPAVGVTRARSKNRYIVIIIYVEFLLCPLHYCRASIVPLKVVARATGTLSYITHLWLQ
jgi:hypothetical protein